MKKGTLITTSILASLFSIIIHPLIAIWAINTLFPQANLDYSFINWCAMIAMKIIFSAEPSSKVDGIKQ